MRLLRFLAIVAGILFEIAGSHPSIAQSQQNATLTGTITDSSGGGVSGATVAAQPLDSTARPTETHSDAAGKFSLTLPSGRYRVSVERESFTQAEQEFTLAASETRAWDVLLKLQALSSGVVVTASAEPELDSETVAPVDIVSRQDIDQRQQIWLTPVFASLPGASFSQLGPMGGSTTFFLDGGNSNYTKVLVDGVPVNQPGGLIDFSNFSVDSIGKIEVVHGASSALYGSDAMDGVIQVFTHRGTTRTPEISLEGDGGMFDTGHGTGQLSGLAGAFDYSFGAGYFSSNGQGPGDYFRDTNLWGNFGWKFSDTDNLRLTLSNSSSDAGQPGQTLLQGESEIGQHEGLHDFSSGLTWSFATGEHWQHELFGFESRYWNLDFSPLFGPPPFITEYNRAGFHERSSYLFTHGSITAGYDYEVENGPTEGRHNQAGYIEINYRFGSRVTAVIGGRMEDNGFFGTRFVPRVGASYAVRYGSGFWGATRLRASYGKGIKEPEILPADCSPQLAPEQSQTVDAGVDQYFGGDRFRFSATFFHNDFHNIVSFASVTSNPNCPAFLGSFFNTDKARAYGANTSFEMKVTKWLRIMGNYTYDDSLTLIGEGGFDDPSMLPGSRLFKRPLHSANLIGNAYFHRMNWNLSGTYVGRRADSDFDSPPVNCTYDPAMQDFCITSDPSYVRWDLANSIDMGHGFSTVAVVNNLFNRHYSDAVGYPALRLNYRLGLKYTWGRQ